ncbi:cytochrome d ubiquinol oxidase subunit II [Natrinema hispanicum]|uniref:Cytochrome bd-I ubiquinol oxidase subunit 2 apoprotein n=1 Tax=Natrinema hispanicum TaxID=392421 RepID=A0A1H9YQP1_9EURY|nr:cytochrome d ubiquinol oxidase subunit II [Natrinema hispanicum]SDC23108.1 cytochrome bd-I ubiquinol oxidase subunit 2 apoprotein [Natrinema hispanicum]SES71460.1 cytochrome bd-I ubiquinol oxidase subunit 2 apoprotein [Natrinema hispanicum]
MTDGGWLANGPLFDLPLADIWFGLVFFIFAMFLFLDGFDFGVGLLFATREDSHEREQLLAAIGPFWDGNEVWLVVFGGALFAAFPAVYGNLFSRHYLLMFAILGALIIRGLAPEMYEQRHDENWQRWWGRAFIVGSVTAPFFLGMFTANWLVGATTIITLPSLVVGLTVVALTVVDGVAFLRLKTRGELRADLQTDGHRALGAYLVLVVLTLAYIAVAVPDLRSALVSPLVVALIVLTLILAGVYAVATSRDRYYVAFVAAAGLVFSLVSIVAGLMYPTIDPAVGLTVDAAIVSTVPLNLMSIGAGLLLPLIFIYFGVLYSAFSGPIDVEESY